MYRIENKLDFAIHRWRLSAHRNGHGAARTPEGNESEGVYEATGSPTERDHRDGDLDDAMRLRMQDYDFVSAAWRRRKFLITYHE